MKSEEDRLVARGRKVPTIGILDQVCLSLGLADEHAEALFASGYSESKRKAFEACFEEMNALMGGRTVIRCDAKHARKQEAEAREVAKSFLCRLRLAAPLVLRDNAITDYTTKSFAPKRPLGRSTTRFLGHLVSLEPVVTDLEEALRPYFRGESPSELLSSVTKALTQAGATQEYRRANAPQATRRLNLVKGRLLEHIDDLNRIGKIAFIDDRFLAKKFDTRLIKRARRFGKRRPRAAADAAEQVAETPVVESPPLEPAPSEAAS